MRNTWMRWMGGLALLVTLVVGLTACEPLDGGGGGGVGGRLALVRSGSLVLSNDDGSSERTITDVNTSAQPALNASGTTVAFAFGVQSSRGIAVLDTLSIGAIVRELAAPGSGETFEWPTWDTTGENVLFVANSGGDTRLVQVSTSTGQVSETGVRGVRFPVFESTNVVLGVNDDFRVVRVNLSSQQVTDLGFTVDDRIARATDGRLAYSRGGRIFVRENASANTETPLPSSGSADTLPAFAPDASLVAFQSGNQIVATPVTGLGLVEPLSTGSDVAWSP